MRRAAAPAAVRRLGAAGAATAVAVAVAVAVVTVATAAALVGAGAGCRATAPPAGPAVAAPGAATCAGCGDAGVGAGSGAGGDAGARDAPVVRVEGALRFDGVPEVDGAVRDQLRPYLDARAAELLDVDATGSRMLITTRFADTRQLHRVDAAGGERVQLTFAVEPISQGRWVPGDDDAFLMIADHGGDERFQLWRVEPDGKVRLTDGTSRNVSPVWSPDGRQLAWTSTARDGVDYDLWISDGRSEATARRVLDREGVWSALTFDADGTRLLLVHTVSSTRSALYVYDVAGGTIAPVGAAEGEGEGAGDGEVGAAATTGDVATPVGRFGAGGRLYVISDRDGGLRRLWEVDGDRWRLLTGDLDHEVEAVEVSRDGRTVAFVVDVDGASELRLLDARTRKHQAARGAPRGGVIGALRFAGPGATLALSWSSPTEPSDVYTYAIASATLTRWTTSELAGLDPAALVTPTRATATAADGVVIPMWTYAPASAAGGAAAPVVVYLHGGPEQQWRPRFDPFVQLLCARGYAVVEPDVRGSTGYGRAFAMLDDGLRRRDAIADVGVVLDWIAGRDDLDAARVAVAGGSYGGFLSMASLIAHGDRLRAGIEVVGISSFVTFLEQTSAYRRDLRRAEYGDERDPEVRAFLDELSPLRHAGEIGDPLFVGHGANDPRVPVAEAEQIVEGVRAGGGDVWYLLADNEGHGFTRRENRAAYWGAVVMFLARYL